MKTVVTLIFVMLFSSVLFSQTENSATNSEVQEPIDTVAILRQISAIDDHLNAIVIKSNYINNNPEEKALAETTGWFAQMATITSELIIKKSLLQEKIK